MKKILFSIAICLAGMLDASAQTDYTSLILNPSFESKSLDGWTNTNFTLTNNKNFTKVDGDYCVEKWVAKGSTVGSASIKQTVRGVPNGKYELTVSAQNYNQSSTTTKCTGAYIYALKLTNRTSVNLPNDYTVSFSVSNGEALIGFNATTSANGNWLCVDNFRLVKVGEIDKTVAKVSLDSLVTVGEGLLSSNMTYAPYINLTAAIDNAKNITSSSTDTEISDATIFISNSIYDARESITACKSLATSVTTAKTYQGKYMQQNVSDALDAAITAAEGVGNTTSEADFQDIVAALSTATENAKTSTTAYSALNSAITTADNAYDAAKNDAATFLTVIDEAKAMYNAKEADAATIDVETAKLKKATLAFNIDNATAGTGTAVKVTYTNDYVPTGATQALMRFNYEGTNIKEKGICYSTEHNPTVLDERSTSLLGNLNGNIYRVSGLSHSTVYYLRPYVMNTTYQVAYGDEVKIVTHPRGTCTWSWDNAGPDDATNERCRTAIKQTIDYFNEWTGISGFNLSGHYVPGAGSGSGTADCSYGGYMRISQNTANQAIGTVLHETGHGVGVGTQSRYWDTNVHNWKWYGSEANKMYSFLENKEANPYSSDFCMVGDGTHAWGSSATYDWFINGSDKDKHIELQYVGGCCLLYAMFVDGLCPTSAYGNGLAGYTYNFDETKKYYLMCKDAEYGLGTGVIMANTAYAVRWKNMLGDATTIDDSAAWYMSFDPETGLYSFKNAVQDKFLKHPTTSNAILGFATATVKTPTSTEKFQLMPARTDVTVTAPLGSFTTKGYWLTTSDLKGMQAQALSSGLGKVSVTSLDYADTGTKQQWIILSEDDLRKYYGINKIGDVNGDGNVDISDVNAIISVICGNSLSPEGERDGERGSSADVNGDGTIDISDVNAVIAIICGN